MVEFFIFVLLASLVVLLLLIIYLWSVRHVDGAVELLLFSLACGLWSLGYVLEILVPNLSYKLFWAKFEYLGIATITVWVLMFIIRYSGHASHFNFRHMIVLLILPCFTFLLTVTNEYHGWMWINISEQPGWSMAPLSLIHGWWFWVEIGYSYLLLVGATVLLMQFTSRIQKHYLSQTVIMLAAMLAPWLGNALYIIGVRPGPNLDLTPIAFTLTNLGLAVGFVRFKLLDILPVAYSSIFKFMSDGLVVLDNKNRIVDINTSARQIFSCSNLSKGPETRFSELGMNDPFIGNKIDELLPELADTHNKFFEFRERELKLETLPEKNSRVYKVNNTPIINQRQQTTGQILIFTDVTRLKKAEEQMRLQVTALETAENGIVITDPQGLIEWANPSFTRLTGYALEEVLNQNPRVLKSGKHPDDFYKTLWDTITSGNVWRGEIINRRKNGSFYYEEMTITPLSRQGGEITHFIAIKQDITERKHVEKQLALAHERALESNRLKTQLLANVSHDMRTPLGAIIGYSDMLQTGIFGEVNSSQKSAISDIQDSSSQLLLFVNNLIGQAQFETGNILIKPKPFLVNDLIEDCKASVGLLVKRKGLLMVYDIDLALPAKLNGDLYWLRQIILNLVNNAVKFTPQGSVKLRLYQPDSAHWAIEVSDTGIGISEDIQEVVFEPFRQGEGVTPRGSGGSGLGLAIVKELVILMGGQINLQSAPNEGSVFTIVLPYQFEEYKR